MFNTILSRYKNVGKRFARMVISKFQSEVGFLKW